MTDRHLALLSQAAAVEEEEMVLGVSQLETSALEMVGEVDVVFETLNLRLQEQEQDEMEEVLHKGKMDQQDVFPRNQFKIDRKL
jgi:hypothetical protein